MKACTPIQINEVIPNDTNTPLHISHQTAASVHSRHVVGEADYWLVGSLGCVDGCEYYSSWFGFLIGCFVLILVGVVFRDFINIVAWVSGNWLSFVLGHV